MPRVPVDLPVQARHGLARIGLEEAALAVIGAGDNFVEAEQAFRAAGRREAVRGDRSGGQAERDRENRFNAAGIRQMERAVAEFQGASQLDPQVRQQIDQAIGRQDFRDRLKETRETFQDLVVGSEIAAAEAGELMQIWDEAQSALEQDGFDGVLNYGRDRAAEVRDKRKESNRGREAHSPLAWWKYAIIGGAIAVGVGAIIACFVWGGCSWVVAMVGFLAGAATSWIIAMINNGCAPIPLSS